jgi:hypothetical protein
VAAAVSEDLAGSVVLVVPVASAGLVAQVGRAVSVAPAA